MLPPPGIGHAPRLTRYDEVEAQGVVERIYAELEADGVAGSVGWAPITVLRGFPAALAEADEAMYAAKRERRARRAA